MAFAFPTVTVDASAHANPAAPATVKFVSFTAAAGATYASGGIPTFTTALRSGAGQAATPLFVVPIAACGGYRPIYDKATDKLLLYWSSNTGTVGIEVADTTNISGAAFKLAVICE